VPIALKSLLLCFAEPIVEVFLILRSTSLILLYLGLHATHFVLFFLIAFDLLSE